MGSRLVFTVVWWYTNKTKEVTNMIDFQKLTPAQREQYNDILFSCPPGAATILSPICVCGDCRKWHLSMDAWLFSPIITAGASTPIPPETVTGKQSSKQFCRTPRNVEFPAVFPV